MFKCLNLQNYNAVNTESIINQGKLTNDYMGYLDAIIEHYQDIIVNNSKVNEHKAKYLKKSIIIFVVYGALSVVSLLFIIVIV